LEIKQANGLIRFCQRVKGLHDETLMTISSRYILLSHKPLTGSFSEASIWMLLMRVINTV